MAVRRDAAPARAQVVVRGRMVRRLRDVEIEAQVRVDLVLPGMDGWALVERLRADVPECAVVVSSVLDSRKYPAAQAILPKPFTRAQILQVLAECVPRWSAR